MADRTFKFLSAVVSDVGVKRTENQDAFSVSHSRDASLFLVADGMGGAKGGATASTLAASIVGAEAFNPDGSIDVNSFRRVIEQANLAIHTRSSREKDLKGMGTTIAALAFVDGRVLVASVGDSRIYFLNDQEFKQLTKDHTLVQELVENGSIKPEDAATHPISHMLTRSLGPVDNVRVDAFEFQQKVEISDRFLICSDGLYNHVKPEELKIVMSNGQPRDVCQKLLKMALERGGSDNITIQVIEVYALNDSSFVFASPAPGKLEINLLGRIEQRQIGSEEGELVVSDDNIDEFDFNGLISECNAPSGVGSPVVVSAPQQSSRKLYMGGAVVAGVLALVMFSKGGSWQESIQRPFAQEPAAKIAQELTTPKTEQEEPSVQKQIEVTELAANAVQTEKVIEQKVEQVVDQTVSPSAQVSSEVMNKVLDRANSLVVPDAPNVKVIVKQDPPDQPIVWENEDRKVIKLKKKDSTSSAEQLGVKEDEEMSYQGGDGIEFKNIFEQKRDLRRRISDLDFKLRLLEDGFKEQQQGRLIQEAEESKVVLNAINAKFFALEQEIISLKGYDKIYDQNSLIAFLEKKSAKSEDLRRLLEEYQDLNKKYRDAVKLWQQNPRELSLASEMGARARQKEEFFKSIQQTAKTAIELESAKVLDLYAVSLIEKQNTEELLEATNRRKGFVDSAFKLEPTRTAAMKEQYLSEREKFVAKIESSKRKLPDEKEQELHKNIILSELKAKL